jgi:hypothetical protein
MAGLAAVAVVELPVLWEEMVELVVMDLVRVVVVPAVLQMVVGSEAAVATDWL